MTDQAVQTYCQAGIEPHNWSSYGGPGIPGWVMRCSMCGKFDLTEVIAAVRSEGWVQMGTHAFRLPPDIKVEFSDELDESGLPVWERLRVVPTHTPCCSSHGEDMSCEKYRRTHFVEVRPCCAIDASILADTDARAEGLLEGVAYMKTILKRKSRWSAIRLALQWRSEG